MDVLESSGTKTKCVGGKGPVYIYGCLKMNFKIFSHLYMLYRFTTLAKDYWIKPILGVLVHSLDMDYLQSFFQLVSLTIIARHALLTELLPAS